MCGIAGFLDLTASTSPAEGQAQAEAMGATLRHRGPDDSGVFVDAEAGVFLSHRRLSIVDLSPSGHQPMRSGSGRYVLVFNGEVYNHRELREEIEGSGAAPAWRGHSDTEVMLAAFERWGIQDAFSRFVGMFSCAVWDRLLRSLVLVRDRLGEKPLYYGRFGNLVLFGSELSALRAHPRFRADVDRDALTLFLRHSAIPAPNTVFRGVAKLMPGSMLRISATHPEPSVATYWSAATAAEMGLRNPVRVDELSAAAELERLLRRTLRQQLSADVPVGALLSGGVDSSSVVALAQAESSTPLRTFTVGFHERGYNEAEHAKTIAHHLGTAHTELYVTPTEAQAIIPRLPYIYDEPFADPSQIPTFLIAQLTRKHVTVALSGDGGDELFGGYTRHFFGATWWKRIQHTPVPLRAALAAAIPAIRPAIWDRTMSAVAPLLPNRFRHAHFGEKVHKLGSVLRVSAESEFYRALTSHWTDPASVVVGAHEPCDASIALRSTLGASSFIEKIMYSDLVGYLPDDILVKVDRAAMAVSLETRAPLLDHRIVEFAWRLPLATKVRGGVGKHVLRQLLYRHVPARLVERPKAGFEVPIGEWLRGPLREWAEDLLAEKRLAREAYFEPGPIRQRWSEHLSRQRDWQYPLWDVLMFQAWLGSGFGVPAHEQRTATSRASLTLD